MDVDQQPLLNRVAAGDAEAVQLCIDRFGALVWSLARRLLGNAAEAEDAVQEIFIDIWRNASRYDARVASEKTFVAMIARRRIIDRRRRLGRAPEMETSELDRLSKPDETEWLSSVETTDEVSRAVDAIRQLKPDQQQLLRLAIHEGWTHQKIADHLQIPLGTVKTNVRRGLMRVRELLAANTVPGERTVTS